MTKPDDISEEVWNAATAVYTAIDAAPQNDPGDDTEIIARALFAAKAEQRKEDAKIANAVGASLNERVIGVCIATAIGKAAA